MSEKIQELIAKKANKTIEEVNDSEPFYLHQGEVYELMKDYGDQEISSLQSEVERLKKENQEIEAWKVLVVQLKKQQKEERLKSNERLAKLLKIKKYSDGSGYDFSKYCSKVNKQ